MKTCNPPAIQDPFFFDQEQFKQFPIRMSATMIELITGKIGESEIASNGDDLKLNRGSGS
jgi:hypothetical protein